MLSLLKFQMLINLNQIHNLDLTDKLELPISTMHNQVLLNAHLHHELHTHYLMHHLKHLRTHQ